MYYAFSISSELRERILATYPAIFEEVICEHCTLVFTPFNNTEYETNTPYTIKITQGLSNECIQCVTCTIDDKSNRPNGGKFHITVSLDRTKGAKPVMSNNLILDYETNNDDSSIKQVTFNKPIIDLVYLKSFD